MIPLSVAAILAVLWYAVVEWTYFSIQGSSFRTIFAAANGMTPSTFSYRAPWLALITYMVLVAAFAVLAVWPAVSVSASARERSASGSTTSSPIRAYFECLWRAVALGAAVYTTYDFTTFSTVFPFGSRHVLIDLVYGVVAIPALVAAPAAALIAYAGQTA